MRWSFPVFPSSLTRLYRIQHVTASIRSCGNYAKATVKDIPPASGDIVHATCRFLQSSSNIWRMTVLLVALDRRHHESQHKPVLEEKKIPTFGGCHLATPLKSSSCEARESVCGESFCLSWKPRSTHLAVALRKLPCLSVLMVSTHRPVTWFFALTFLMSMRSKNSLSTQDLCSRCFASANCL